MRTVSDSNNGKEVEDKEVEEDKLAKEARTKSFQVEMINVCNLFLIVPKN